mmetsp:Transcript_45014/g.118938  ORF Transcript_45014/g.118938 Transcript_45014/m.118938 type:complete len:188 (-) Transcript_45014:31-594(-)
MPHRNLSVPPPWRRAGFSVCGRPSSRANNGSSSPSVASEAFILGRSPSPDSRRVESYYSASPEEVEGAESYSRCRSGDDQLSGPPSPAERRTRTICGTGSPDCNDVADHSAGQDASEAESAVEDFAAGLTSEYDPLSPRREFETSCPSVEEARTASSASRQSCGGSAEDYDTLYDTYPPLAAGGSSQ